MVVVSCLMRISCVLVCSVFWRSVWLVLSVWKWLLVILSISCVLLVSVRLSCGCWVNW